MAKHDKKSAALEAASKPWLVPEVLDEDPLGVLGVVDPSSVPPAGK